MDVAFGYELEMHIIFKLIYAINVTYNIGNTTFNTTAN